MNKKTLSASTLRDGLELLEIGLAGALWCFSEKRRAAADAIREKLADAIHFADLSKPATLVKIRALAVEYRAAVGKLRASNADEGDPQEVKAKAAAFLAVLDALAGAAA